MNVKTFRSSTIKDALSQVREQLGPDAVILETRQNNDGRRPVVEILAGDDAALGGEAKPLFAPTATAYGAAAYAKSQTQAGPIASEPSAKTTGSIPMTPNDFGVNDELRALRREIRRVAEVHRADEDPVDRALATFGRQFERGLSESTDLLRALLAETRAQSGMGMDPAQARVYSLLTYNGVEDVLAEDMVRGLTAGEKSRALRENSPNSCSLGLRFDSLWRAVEANASPHSSGRRAWARPPPSQRSLPTRRFVTAARSGWLPSTPIALPQSNNSRPTPTLWKYPSRLRRTVLRWSAASEN